MDYQKTCVICGKDFIGHANHANTCSIECKKARRKLTNRQYHEKVKHQMRIMRGLANYVQPDIPLTEIVNQARQYGLTYGMYMAYKQREMIT